MATAWSALVGLVAVAPFALPAAGRQDWVGLSLGAWASLVYASAVSMLVAYTLWSWAIERRGVGRTVPYLFLVPVVTGLLAVFLLDERFGPFKVVGGLLVLVGTALVRGVSFGTWPSSWAGWRRRHSAAGASVPAPSPSPDG